MDLDDQTNQVSIFLNRDISVSCEASVFPHTSVRDLISKTKEKLKIKSDVDCILYDSNGAELSDDDVDCIDFDKPLFLSLGEKFSKSSSLAMYKKIKKLGQGGFGSVYLYEHKKTHENFAIKFVKIKSLLSTEDVNRIYSEIALLRDFRHSNIVKLHESFTLQEDICLVMEYCSGEELGAYLRKTGPLAEVFLYNIALQIVNAVRYCHNSKVVHRDLKLENILFADDSYTSIKIVDFGISGVFRQNKDGERSNAGSILYIPPEIYRRKDNRANPAIDIWAIGCILYYLLTGFHPFMQPTVKETIQNIEKVNYQPLPSTVSKPWNKLIGGILRLNPDKRWSIIKIQEHLEKYFENPDLPVSDCSDEEETKKDLFLSFSATSDFLKAPKNYMAKKSHSPYKEANENTPKNKKFLLPHNPASHNRVLSNGWKSPRTN
jgi:serine/threonine protein kinase